MRYRPIHLFAIVLMSSCASLSQHHEVTQKTCIGPNNATHFAVYLHGQDINPPGPMEISNRENLENLANKLNMRIALPRATTKCPNKPNLLCWGWNFNRQTALDDIPIIQNAAQTCFPNAKTIGLIGFSSGGYLINQIFQNCLASVMTPKVTWMVSTGSTFGHWNENDHAKDFSQCGVLTFLAGKHDTYNYDPKNAYFNFLVAHGAHATLHTFDGGHQLPDDPLQKILSDQN